MKPVVRWTAWLLGILLVLLVAIVIFILTFDWNRAKPWISERVSAATHRSFAIDGDLSVSWRRQLLDDATRSWLPWPQVNAKALKFGNAEWAASKQMVQVDEIDFAISPLPLLARTLSVPAIRLGGADVDIERLKDGRANWNLELAGHGGGTWNVKLGDIVLDSGKVKVDDAIERIKLDIDVEPLEKSVAFSEILNQEESEARGGAAATIGEGGARKFRDAASASEKKRSIRERAPTEDYEFAWRVAGSFRGVPVEGRGRSGGILALHSEDQTFPLQARLRVGNTRIAFVGTLSDPASLNALDMRLWLSGKSMSDLYPLTGVTLPDTPPFATEGHLSAELAPGANVFRYEEFTGRVGGSDIGGSLTYAEGEPRPKLTGKVHSDLLQFTDLAPLVGGGSPQADTREDAKASPGLATSERLLPAAEFRTDRWNAMDADVEFTGKRVVQAEELPIDNVQTHVSMAGGKLALKPLGFGLAGGRVDSTIRLDGTRKPMNGEIDLRLAGLKLKQLFPNFAPMQTTFGEVNGSAALSAKGNSIASLLGASNGEVKLLVNDGAISKGLLETAGLNIANIVITRIFGDKDVQIHCAASHFVMTEGVLDSKLFVFDTEDAIINISGTADFGQEKLDFDVRPHTKGLRIFSLRSPLYVQGTFAKPDVGVKKGPLLVRGGGALILGIFAAPAAALIPLIAPSHGEPNRCEALLAEMRGKAKAP